MEGVKGRKGDPTPIIHHIETAALHALHASTLRHLLRIIRNQFRTHFSFMSVTVLYSYLTEIALLAAHSPLLPQKHINKTLRHTSYTYHKTNLGIICSAIKTLTVFRLQIVPRFSFSLFLIYSLIISSCK